MDDPNVYAPFLHKAQLANAVTGFATCFAGIMPMLYTLLTKPQPPRWFFAYFCILLTGIPTVWLHAYEGNRLASAADVGSNIFLVWAIQLGVAGDFLSPRNRWRFTTLATLINFSVIAFIFYEITLPVKVKALDFGAFGQFYIGELALIINGWIVAGIFYANLKRVPEQARGLLHLMFTLFFLGMILASAANSHVILRVFAWHAMWHIVGAFALVTLWLFNHVRFNEPAPARAA